MNFHLAEILILDILIYLLTVISFSFSATIFYNVNNILGVMSDLSFHPHILYCM